MLANAFVLYISFDTESIDKIWFKYFNTPSIIEFITENPKYIDKNHAGVFIIWDKLFGTFQEEEERTTYGITIPKSWDPIWANFAHFSLAKILVKVKSPLDGLKVLFKTWMMPDYMGGPILPSKI